MNFPDPVVFFKALGLTVLVLLFLLSFFYWIIISFKKVMPNFKYWFKYKILRKKYDNDIVKILYKDLENNISNEDLYKRLLLSGNSKEKADEFIYIYKKMKEKMKGGVA